MIEPVPDKRDWFYVSDDDLAIVKGLPGTGVLLRKRAILHRSHLPLLNTDEAENTRAILTYGKTAWVDRDAWTNARGFQLRVLQQQAIDFTDSRRGALIGDDMRCIDGAAEVAINRAGKSFKTTLAALWFSFNGGKTRGHCWNPKIPTTIRALCDGFFRQHQIKAVIKNGRKAVFKLQTQSGKTLRLTGDHEVALADGDWRRADRLQPGDQVLTNGQAKCKRCGSTKNVVTYEYAKFRGFCKECMYRHKRAKPTWVGGKFPDADGYIRVSGQHGRPRHKGGQVAEHILVMEKHLGRYLAPGEVVHNQLSNLELTTQPEHMRHHGHNGGFANMDGGRAGRGGLIVFVPKVDQVVSITPDGEADVFDVVCEDPHRNFVANGIVVHNCGKTLSALMSHDPDRGQLVIVAPLQTRAVWLGWAKRCFPDLEIGVCISKKFDPELFNKPIVFCHYDIIHCWQALTPIGTLIFDEAHLLTNAKTRRVNAAVVLQCRALKTIALTGTPVWNRPAGLWAIVGLVAPGAWGGYHEFGNRYGLPVSTGYGVNYTGSSNEAELNCRLQEIMIRRLWRDCAEDLPAISRSVVVAEVSDTDRRKLDILAGSLKSERTNTAGNLASYRRQVAGIKAGVAVKEATKILDRQEPVVIWTYHRDLAESLHEAIGNERSYLIHGEIAPAERERRMDAWKTDPLPNALIATMSVAQVGIDLSHARIAIFVEIDYTPAVLGQAEMRTFALGRPMDIIFIVANHLVDQRIIRALVAKLASADSLNVGAAVDAIDALRDAVMGAQETGDVDRLLEDFLASAA